MAYLMDLALAVTRAIDRKRLYDWMIAISKAVGSSPAIIGLGPFDTVARASSSRLLDAGAGDLASIDNGAVVWVESFGGGPWTWRTDFPAATPTDNVKTCRPTAWIATGNDGAFVRGLEGSQVAKQQAAWFVNSTAADNEGAGTLTDPVQSDDEIVRRWGPNPWLQMSGNAVTITYAQIPTIASAIDVGLYPDMLLRLVGTPTEIIAGVAITAVQAQVRTPGAEVPHAITGVGLGASSVGKIAIIRASAVPGNVGATARVLADLGADQVMTSPFGVESVDFTVFTEITPLVGDEIDVLAPMNFPVAHLRFTSESNVFLSDTPPRNVVVTEWLRFDGGTFAQGCIETNNISLYAFRCIARNVQFMGVGAASVNLVAFAGGGWDDSIYISGSVGFYRSGGIDGFLIVTGNGVLLLDTDTYFQNSTASVFPRAYCSSFGAAYWNVASGPAIHVVGTGLYQSAFGVPEWGTANAGYAIRMRSAGVYTYVVKPTINGTLGPGREALIGGTDKIYTQVPYIEGNNNAALVLQS